MASVQTKVYPRKQYETNKRQIAGSVPLNSESDNFVYVTPSAVTYPYTATGMRLDLCINGNGTVPDIGHWALAVVRAGDVPPVLSLLDFQGNNAGAKTDFTNYDLRDIIMTGALAIGTSGASVAWEKTVSTKVMRKMKSGDQLCLVLRGTAADAATNARLNFVFTFFERMK